MRLLPAVLFGALAAAPALAQDTLPAKEIALGENIFKGKAAGGTCLTCHQSNAKGLPGLAPDLTDKIWLHGDGSLAAIIATIEKGVAKPKLAGSPMLPRGGVNLTTDQVRAVAVYVYSLSHR